jgi:chaperonin GroES
VATATKTKSVQASKSSARAVATTITKKFRPLGDRVVVQPGASDEMTKSGIVIPDTAKEKHQEGTIVATGPGRVLDDGNRESMVVKAGDKVLYGEYAGTQFQDRGRGFPDRQPEGHPGDHRESAVGRHRLGNRRMSVSRCASVGRPGRCAMGAC